MMNSVLMYHSIGGQSVSRTGEDLYSVSVENLREQIAFIKDTSGHRSQVTGRRSKAGNIVITFDDGLIDNYTVASPILKEFGLKAYFFVVGSKIGQPGYMNFEQLRQLQKNGLVIGSHSMRHKILTELSDGELDYELSVSKKYLEFNLGQEIEYFSIPKGHYNKRIIDKVKEAGYKAVFTSNPKDNDGFRFGRIAIRSNWDLDYFIRVLNNGYSIKDKAKELIKNSSKRLLGVKDYDRIRVRLLGR